MKVLKTWIIICFCLITMLKFTEISAQDYDLSQPTHLVIENTTESYINSSDIENIVDSELASREAAIKSVATNQQLINESAIDNLKILPNIHSETTLPVTWKNATNTNKEIWNVKFDMNFTDTIPNESNPIETDVRVNYDFSMKVIGAEDITEDLHGTVKMLPIAYIMKYLMKNIETALSRSKSKTDRRISNINSSLVVQHNDNKTAYTARKTLYGSNLLNVNVDDIIYPNNESSDNYRNDKGSDDRSIQIHTDTGITTSEDKLKQPCQEYKGNACKEHLDGRHVYIPLYTSLMTQEMKLINILNLIEKSKDFNWNCKKYIRRYLCYSTFPICKDELNAYQSYEDFFDPEKQKTNGIEKSDIIYSMTFGDLPNDVKSKTISRICKDDCEVLEKEMCVTEFAIMKTHRYTKNYVQNCQNLDDAHDCLVLDLPRLPSNATCVYGDGHIPEYLGRVDTSMYGYTCLKWTEQTHVKISDYPYLPRQKNYCRNPGGQESQPWCIVKYEEEEDLHFCDIPKCALWGYV